MESGADSKMDFTGLPLEIKYKIFSYLTDNELRSKAALVSKDWQQMAQDPFFQTSLNITQQGPLKILQLKRKFKRIKVLSYLRNGYWKWIKGMPELISVHDLEFWECRFETSSTISKLLVRVPLVRTISISFCEFVEMDCSAPLSECQFLIYVKINHDRALNCPHIFLENCGIVEEMSSMCNCLSNETFRIVAKKQRHHLEALTFYGYVLSSTSYLLLQNYSKLTYLHISDGKMLSNDGLLAIKKLNNLEELSLSDSNADFIYLFTDAKFHHLNSLHILSCKNLSNEAVQLIPESCPILRELDLQDFHHNLDIGLTAIVEQCSSLEEISFYTLRNTTGQFVKRIPSQLSKLRLLDIYNCDLIPKCELVQLKQLRPDIHIAGVDPSKVIDLSCLSLLVHELRQ